MAQSTAQFQQCLPALGIACMARTLAASSALTSARLINITHIACPQGLLRDVRRIVHAQAQCVPRAPHECEELGMHMDFRI